MDSSKCMAKHLASLMLVIPFDSTQRDMSWDISDIELILIYQILGHIRYIRYMTYQIYIGTY